jgi:hypothetical protein
MLHRLLRNHIKAGLLFMNRVWFTADRILDTLMDPLARDPSWLPLSHSYYDNALRVAVAIISNWAFDYSPVMVNLLYSILC